MSDAESAPGVLKNVKILGFNSVNRRRYTQEAVAGALSLYEGVAVNLDHPKDGPNSPRSVLDRFGKLVGVHLEGDGLRGDLHYNPKHSRAAEIAWYAEHMPDMIGLSHNAIGEGDTREGVFVVEKIHQVRSVDLVADPATTKGLFEAMDEDLMAGGGGDAAPVDLAPAPGGDEPAASYRDQLGPLVSAIVDDPNLSKADKRKKVLAALNLLDDDEAGGGDSPLPDVGDEPDGDEEVPADDGADDDGDEEEVPVDETRRHYALLVRKERVRQLAEDLRVPATLVTNIFVESVARLDSEAQVKQALRDRLTASKASAPKSASAGAGRRLSTEEFARALEG